jgi:hypothetical protein
VKGRPACRIFLLCGLALAWLALGGAAAAGFVQTFESGQIDWGSGEIAARAIEPAGADALAARRLLVQLRKGLLDMLGSVRIDAGASVAVLLAANELLAANVRGFVQNSPFSRIPAEPGPAGAASAIGLRGALSEMLIPAGVPFQSGIPPRSALIVAKNPAQALGVKESLFAETRTGFAAPLAPAAPTVPAHPAPPPLAEVGAYTGIVIDARGLSPTPALLPMIYDDKGLGVYGAFAVSRASAVNLGLVAYAQAPDDPLVRERAGTRPLRIRAVGLTVRNGTDPILSSEDARAARGVLKSREVIENCRVVILP